MKKTARAISLLLAVVMVFAVMAGCGESAAQPTQAPATQAPATQAPATQKPTGGEETPDEPELLGAYNLPLVEEETTLTLWSTMRSSALTHVDHLGATDPFVAAAEHTNVVLEAISVSGKQGNELFPIMISSGEYTDFMGSVDNLYTGGGDAAIADEIIIDLYDVLKENAPNYWAVVESKDVYMRELTTDEGNMPFLATINPDAKDINKGLAIRQDWLDKVNMDAPKTYDDMYKVLTAFKTELGVESPLWIDYQVTGRNNAMVSGYDIAGSNNPKSTGAVPFYVEDGIVKCGWNQGSLREYLTMIKKWYNEGLIWKDFAMDANVGISISTSEAMPDVLSGKIGVVFMEFQDFTNFPANADAGQESMAWTAIQNPSLDGGVDHIYPASTGVTKYWSISTQCEDPALACLYIDFFYTELGSNLANYGIEGKSWEYDANGNKQFTDFILNNPDGITVDLCGCIYMCDSAVYLSDASNKRALLYDAACIEAIDAWCSYNEGSMAYPTSASMTSEEADVYGSAFNEIATYVSEALPKFVMGELNLEGDFDAYVAQIESMGLADCLDAKQDAYDRYMNR